MKKNLTWIYRPCLLLAVLILLVGIIDQGTWYLLSLIVFWIGLFLLEIKNPWRGLPSLMFITNCLIAGILCFTDFPILLLVVTVAITLIAWDLMCLRITFDQFHTIKGAESIIRAHLTRLGVISIVSLSMAVLSRSIELRIDFGWILVAGIIALLGLSLLFRNLHPENRKV